MALPVRIDIKDAFEASCTELTVTANIDSGGRGRPRVTFDVTQGLSAAGVGVFMADGEAQAVRAVLCCAAPCCAVQAATCAPNPADLPLSAPNPHPPVYIERPGLDPYGAPLAGGPPAQEMHRFLIHLPSE